MFYNIGLVFCHISTWIGYRYTHVPSLVNLRPTSHPSKLSRSIRCKLPATEKFHQLSNLTHGDAFVSVLLSQFFPPSPSLPVSTSLLCMGFPCGSAGKESTCNAGDLGLIPGLGRSPGEGKGYPLQYSGLENSMDCIVHGVAENQTWLSDFHFHSLPSSLCLQVYFAFSIKGIVLIVSKWE